MSSQRFRIAVSAVALGLMLPLHATRAQSTTTAAPATTSSTGTAVAPASVGRLAEAYAPSIGSPEAARAVVEAMRAGNDVTVGDVTVSGSGKTMGIGNIDIALSLAMSQMAPDATSKDFLSALDGVMDQRASGMGWGNIAKSLGVSLGQVMSASKSAKAADVARSSKSARASTGMDVAAAGKSGVRGDSGKSNGNRGDAGSASSNSGNSGSGNNGNGGGGGGSNGGGGGGGGGKK